MNCPKCKQEMRPTGFDHDETLYCHDCGTCFDKKGNIPYKLYTIKNLVEDWIGKQGHDSCWYYPDIFKSICNELGIEWKEPILPSRQEFERGCCKFQDELFGVQKKKYRCEECNDTRLVSDGLGDVEFCMCYYAGGRND